MLPNAEARLHTLEQVNDAGHAWVPNVPLSEGVMQKFGLDPDPWRSSGVGRDVPVAESCGLCARPIESLQRAVIADGNVVHDECRRLTTRELTDDMATFLDDFEGRRFCHACLAALFATAYDEARKAVGVLRVRPHVRVDSGECSVCGKQRVTIWLVRG